MAKGKYQQWLAADRLAQVENWAAKGCTVAELAHNMGVSRSTLNAWQATYPAISDAIKKGRAESVTAVENAAFRLAVGDVTERTEVTTTMPDGSVRTEVREHRPAPSVPMAIFLLKNRAGYRDNPPDAPGRDEAPADPLSAALAERAGRL